MTLRSSNALGPMPSGAAMRTVDERVVQAPAQRMFDLAVDVERWPSLLAHYRYVRFRERVQGIQVVEMSANRPFGPVNWPTRWVSLMEVQHLPQNTDSALPVIRFRHIDGVTRGMEVAWSFVPVTDGVRVIVEHLWNGPAWPLVGRAVARLVIGPVFVHGIASRTLEGLARAAEQAQTSAPAFSGGR